MSNWKIIWNSNNEYILSTIWSTSRNHYVFRVERKLLNLPHIEIVYLLSLDDLTEEQKTLLELGYTHQFVISEIAGNVSYPSSSLDTLEHTTYYLMKAERILKTMQHEVARTMGIWIA